MTTAFVAVPMHGCCDGTRHVNYQTLNALYRAGGVVYPPNLALRVHRALSWLNRAEQCDDTDGRFIFLWIAFNAAYAADIDEQHRLSEQEIFKAFFHRLCNMDSAHSIEGLLWSEFPGSIRAVLNNRFVFQSFWEYQKGNITQEQWETRFAKGRRSAQQALANRDTVVVLGVLFNRIYTLRNQLMHGGATCGSSVNREQVRDCGNFLEKLVPVIIRLLMENPETPWSNACYPVVTP